MSSPTSPSHAPEWRPSPCAGAHQIGDLVAEPKPGLGGLGNGRPAQPVGAGRLHARRSPPGAAAALGLGPRASRARRKRLSSLRLIGLSGASCFLFRQGPAKMVGAAARSRCLPQSPSIRLSLGLLAREAGRGAAVRPEPPRAAGCRVGPRAPAPPARPFSFPPAGSAPASPRPRDRVFPTRRAASAPRR